MMVEQVRLLKLERTTPTTEFDLNTPGLTDGNLLIDQIGSTGSGSGILTTAATITFHGYVPRFGIIETDIGTASAAQLAQDLYKLYKP